jgi:uncharacterized protein with FMN-binding domain
MVKKNNAVKQVVNYLLGALLILLVGTINVACSSANLELKKGSVPAGKLKDGRYIGRANLDWRNTAEVEITVEKGMITHIRVIHHKHGPDKKYSADVIIQRIIKAQSTDVDVVTGATVTSRVITGAVQDALNRALLSSPE